VVIVAALASASCSGRARTSDERLGQPTTTGRGNVVTVYGWRGAAGGSAGAAQGGGLQLRSCRTNRHGLVLDAGAFAIRTARGAVLSGNGSRLDTAGSDCVTGEVLYDVPSGDRPEYALYRAGASVLRWRLAPPAGTG
jgi:hypothetical protein